LTLAVDESEIIWRKRPGLKAIDHLPVMVGQEKPNMAVQATNGRAVA
jgi:cytochrome P450 PksS